MPKPTDVIISVKFHHAHNLQNGKKTVELRRRTPHLLPGTRVWIYTKVPHGSVGLIGIVEQVVKDSPPSLWKRFGKETGITEDEFIAYFGEKNLGCAILFKQIKRLSPSVALNELRDVSSSFHPPQFLKHLTEGSPELQILRASKWLAAGKKNVQRMRLEN